MSRTKTLLAAAAAMALAFSVPLFSVSAQVARSGGTVKVRVVTPPRDSATRARREALLLRIDSLRNVFENERMTDTERDRIASEMHRTVMALQESLDDESPRSATMARRVPRESSVDVRMTAPELAIAFQSAYRARGYLGVSFDGPSVEEIRSGGERIIRFLEYPRIALVEPSSPAERAGLAEGDTLLAFNGADVRERQISLTKLLVPDQRIVMRVRRDGNPKDFRVRIEEAPGYVMSRTSSMTPMAPVAAVTAMSPMPAPMPALPSPVRVYPGEDLPRRTPMVAAIPTPSPMATTSVWVMTDGVGGAKVETINAGLARAVGVKAGVLVLRVGPGTPAYESGLRDGDVILRASGRPVASVRELRALVENDNVDGVRLVVRRDRRERELTLRW